MRNRKYLGQGLHVRDLISIRGKRVEDYVDWLHKIIDGNAALLKEVHDTEVGKHELEIVEVLLIVERAKTMRLADEVHGWPRTRSARTSHATSHVYDISTPCTNY